MQGTPQFMNAVLRMTETANPQTTVNTINDRISAVGTLKILGGVQLGLGVGLCVLSQIVTIVDSLKMTEEKRYDFFIDQ